ncbi:MAG: hypothetical protein R2778_18340 [Saprospiraceae bacterium]
MGDIASRREEMKVLETKIQEQSKAESIQSEKISKLTESEAKRKAEISDAESKQETLVKKLSDHNRILDARRNEFKLTKSMVESLEGFPESIKFLSPG